MGRYPNGHGLRAFICLEGRPEPMDAALAVPFATLGHYGGAGSFARWRGPRRFPARALPAAIAAALALPEAA